MSIKDFKNILNIGETDTVEFKSWVKAKDTKERIALIVDELIAFANAKGGTVYIGVEDDGTVTGCDKYDIQKLIEAIYDKTRPPIFADVEDIDYKGKHVLAFSIKHTEGYDYSTTDGRFLKRLGKNSKPYYPESNGTYSITQSGDFSAKVIMESSVDDINLVEVYNLKEKLKLRDPQSTLIQEEDYVFLSDLGLIDNVNDEIKLTVAGLLFVGKEASIAKLLPQAEVIYLHYDQQNLEEYNSRLDLRQPIVSVLDRLTQIIQNDNKIQNLQIGLFRLEVADFSEKVFQEAILNALSHRDYQNQGAIYIKHYPDRIVIDNPGGFVEGVTVHNIITHPSVPRNKLIAETLQRLKYVQRTGQGVDIIYREMISMGKPYPEYREYNDAVSLTIMSATDDLAFVKFIAKEQDEQQKLLSLAQLMVMRYLSDNKKLSLSDVKKMAQISDADAKKSCGDLVKMGLIEFIGNKYMLTARVYESIKSDVEYTKDKVVQYIRAKGMILEYLHKNKKITNAIIQELCGFSKQQARSAIDKMRNEEIIRMVGKGRNIYYELIE